MERFRLWSANLLPWNNELFKRLETKIGDFNIQQLWAAGKYSME